MTRRPTWTSYIITAIDDALDDASYPADGSADDLHDEVETAVKAIFCKAYGHEIVDDQCGIPAHRYCVYCGRREPDIEANP